MPDHGIRALKASIKLTKGIWTDSAIVSEFMNHDATCAIHLGAGIRIKGIAGNCRQVEVFQYRHTKMGFPSLIFRVYTREIQFYECKLAIV